MPRPLSASLGFLCCTVVGLRLQWEWWCRCPVWVLGRGRWMDAVCVCVVLWQQAPPVAVCRPLHTPWPASCVVPRRCHHEHVRGQGGEGSKAQNGPHSCARLPARPSRAKNHTHATCARAPQKRSGILALMQTLAHSRAEKQPPPPARATASAPTLRDNRRATRPQPTQPSGIEVLVRAQGRHE